MKIKIFLFLIPILIFTSGCSISLDPYENAKYGQMAIDTWFNSETLGETRKKAENINEIVSTECTFVEKKSNKYVFKCEITYKEQGETVIPLSKNSTIDVYTVFIKENGNTYDSKVYNSKYTKEDGKVWEQDEYLDY